MLCISSVEANGELPGQLPPSRSSSASVRTVLDLGRQIDADVNPSERILLLDCAKQRIEPLGRAKVANDLKREMVGKIGAFGEGGDLCR